MNKKMNFESVSESVRSPVETAAAARLWEEARAVIQLSVNSAIHRVIVQQPA